MYHAPDLVYRENSRGVKNGPRKFPSVDSTTVNAWFPCAWPVMTTLLAMVVGVHPHISMPSSSPGSIKSLFVAHADTIPNITDEVSR